MQIGSISNATQVVGLYIYIYSMSSSGAKLNENMYSGNVYRVK